MDITPSDIRDLPTLARERVTFAPPPDWVLPSSYNPDFAPKVRGPITHLLIERQAHAELHQVYFHTAMRLESILSVQKESQWRLQFEPQTQSIVLHSIKIRRGAVETEHVSVQRMQFLQREAGLEGCMIDGWITLLLLLEDVSPGDTLEYSFTITNRPRLLPENFDFFFSLPPGVEVGKYHFSILHHYSRPLKWKSSSPDLVPTISQDSDRVRCFWLGENISSPEPESCTPSWLMLFPWIQVSDCPDWATVVRAVFDAWKEEPPGDEFSTLIEQINADNPDLLARVNKAIERVQDGFRYLSVNLELGGQIPAPAQTVMRRRYGDCKDLSFLLVRLLRALGIPARPVLVDAHRCRSIAALLPSPGVFNHAIVEYEIENERRWVDVTLKGQGGGALKRLVPDFGLGLPIDLATTELASVPKPSLPVGSYEIKESFLLDTTGSFSYLAMLVTARGLNAEAFRAEFEKEGLESVAKSRAQNCANRFSKATRIGQLQFRDDRDLNEFVLAEVFEIDGFLKQDSVYNTCLFPIQSDPTAGLLACPSIAPRRNPFALPFPCDHTHIIEIDFAGLDMSALPVLQEANEFFSFSRRSKALPKFLRLTFSLSTRADCIPPDRVQDHRQHVESVWRESAFPLRLPVGYARVRKRSDFGALPLPTRSAARPGTAAVAPVTLPAPKKPDEPKPTVIEPHSQPQTAAAPVEKRVFIDPVAAATADRDFHRLAHDHPFSHSRRNRMNRRCRASLLLFLGSIVAFIIAAMLGKTSDGGGMAGLIFLCVIPAFVWSLVLAVRGFRQCSRYPDRYPRGKTAATVTLVLGALFSLVLVPALFSGVNAAIAGAKARSQLSKRGPELLKFGALNCAFHSPEPPWTQTDARMFGRDPILAFARREPMFFTLCANGLGPGYSDATKHVLELSKANVKNSSTSYELLSEQEVAHNGLSGWQTETQASFQGHEFYLVHFVFATNGFGYQLSVWGRPSLKAEVRQEAERLFSRFELTPAQN